MTSDVKEMFAIYTSNGMRSMPIYGIKDGCKHTRITCAGHCFGKVPTTEHWPEKPRFKQDDFHDDCNIALIMGKQFDGRWFVGIDIDGGLDLKSHFEYPETLECTTRRGRHLVFEVPPDTPLGNWTNALDTINKKIGYRDGVQAAVDVKYCRGAMVSPPSVSSSGERYRWVRFMKPAMLPAQAIEYLIKKRKKAYPLVPRYRRWSHNPAHKGQKP